MTPGAREAAIEALAIEGSLSTAWLGLGRGRAVDAVLDAAYPHIRRQIALEIAGRLRGMSLLGCYNDLAGWIEREYGEAA